MSEHWEFYATQMNDAPATILVDIGISKILDSLPEIICRIEFSFSNPTPGGLPSSPEENELANAIEDELSNLAEAEGHHYLGRLTCEGKRYFFFYTANPPSLVIGMKAINDRRNLELKAAAIKDPDHEQYWNTLYPTGQDWQVIKDTKVLQALAQDNDDPSIEREVDHFAYFKDIESATEFQEWAQTVGCQPRHEIELDDDSYSVKLYHIGRMDLRSITNVTVPLALKAEQLGGNYDGWGTPLMRRDPS
ncbi:DUF695 domain-containing protein [Rubinisphaera margarita]|uniref:DUF695 domain-containing protein n=1 Tax=Rubinisphaera margarita TaxID=2909586 RepID=UPI001EE94D14|nr:DUF695 domain-containing protein [Rubinisphaera margarita]MCG6154859.1 DUF695 domain-containing protein [Rubinisphaera margarita]